MSFENPIENNENKQEVLSQEVLKTLIEKADSAKFENFIKNKITGIYITEDNLEEVRELVESGKIKIGELDEADYNYDFIKPGKMIAMTGSNDAYISEGFDPENEKKVAGVSQEKANFVSNLEFSDLVTTFDLTEDKREMIKIIDLLPEETEYPIEIKTDWGSQGGVGENYWITFTKDESDEITGSWGVESDNRGIPLGFEINTEE